MNSIMGVSVYVCTNQQPQIMRQNLNTFLTFRTIHHILLYFWSFWASICMMIAFNSNSGYHQYNSTYYDG